MVSRRGALWLTLLALLWGSNFLWIKIALDGLSPVQVTFSRLVLGAVVLIVIVWVRREPWPRSWSFVGHLVVAALLANAVPYLLFAVGEQTVDSSIAGVLNASTPLFTVLVALAVRQDTRISLVRSVGLVLGFAGTVVIFQPWNTVAGSVIGALACLAASVSYALSYVYMSRYLAPRGQSPFILAAGQLTCAAVLLALVVPMAGMQPIHLAAPVVWAMVALGPIGTGLAYIVNYRLVIDGGATSASTVTYLIPIVSVALGALVLSEPLTPAMIAGGVVVLVGVALARRTVAPSVPDREPTTSAG